MKIEITHMNLERLEEYAVRDGVIEYAVFYDTNPDIRFSSIEGSICIDHIMRGKPLPDGAEPYQHERFVAAVRAARQKTGSTFEEMAADFRRGYSRRKNESLAGAREYYPKRK